MRFFVSGPVSSHFCLPQAPNRGSSPGVFGRGRYAFEHAARAELGAELRIFGGLRVVRVLRLFLGVEVIEIAEELVEAVHRRQEFVAVAEMVLAELPGHVALRLEQVGQRRVLVGQALLRRRQADLEQAGADRALSGDEGGAAGGAGLLGVIVGEDRAFLGDAVDVGRAVAHHAAIVGADVPVADVVAHDDEDVRLLGLGVRAPLAPTSVSAARAEAATQFFKLNVILLPVDKSPFDRRHVYEMNSPVQYHLWYWTIMALYRILRSIDKSTLPSTDRNR